MYRRRRSGLLWAIPVTPALVFADNFDRDQTTPATFLENSPVSSSGHTWSWDGIIAGGIQLIEQNAHCMTSNSTGTAYSTPDLGSPDMYVQYAAPSVLNVTGGFMCARLLDRNNFIGIRSGTSSGQGQIEVYVRAAGTLTNLYRSANNAFVQLDTLRLEVEGTAWRAYKNGTLLSSGTFSAPAIAATQKAGLVARTTSGGGIADDFQSSIL